MHHKYSNVNYNDEPIRSIENASKNPGAIDKWIQSISDLHRSKPPPQVELQATLATHFVSLLTLTTPQISHY
jgi:hypothetical protein